MIMPWLWDGIRRSSLVALIALATAEDFVEAGCCLVNCIILGTQVASGWGRWKRQAAWGDSSDTGAGGVEANKVAQNQWQPEYSASHVGCGGSGCCLKYLRVAASVSIVKEVAWVA